MFAIVDTTVNRRTGKNSLFPWPAEIQPKQHYILG